MLKNIAIHLCIIENVWKPAAKSPDVQSIPQEVHSYLYMYLPFTVANIMSHKPDEISVHTLIILFVCKTFPSYFKT